MVPGTGLLAACVPGMFDTWMLLLRDYGTMRLRDVLAPAIDYARDGYPLVERANATIATVEHLFREHWPTSAAVYLPDGKVPAPGTLFTNTDAGRDLCAHPARGGERRRRSRRADRARAQDLVARLCRRSDRPLLPHAGGDGHRAARRITACSPATTWRAGSRRVEAPLTYDYGRYTVCKAGRLEPGPGDAAAARAAQGLRSRRARSRPSADFIHLQVECAKLAFADREKFYGDPKFVEVPIETLLSDAYNAERRKLITRQGLARIACPGSIEGFGAVVKLRRAGGAAASAVGAMGAGEPTVGRFGEVRGDTVHFDIIDQRRQHGLGDAVRRLAAILAGHSRSSASASAPARQMFWLEEGHPAALAPGKRPRTTLTPTMALRDGEPYLAWGSPGGDQQDQWTTQFFLRHVHAGMNLQEAIDAPAWHSEHFPISFWPRTARPGVLVVEGRVPEATVEELRRRGHVVEVGPTGRKAGSPRPRASAAAAAPPPIRAACRATRRAGDVAELRARHCLHLAPSAGRGRRPAMTWSIHRAHRLHNDRVVSHRLRLAGPGPG